MYERLSLITIALILFFICPQYASAENIDPDNDGSQYAWGEHVGWINLEPSLGPGVTVTDAALTGYAWGENIGWINLNPIANGGVLNDGTGTLSGNAWGENVGWINFAPAGGGVTIDPGTGEFSGSAWGENIGWINFTLGQGISVRTSWTGIIDNCPDNPDKTEPGICGCEVPDTDTDGDGTFDCYDLCSDDPGKIEPGVCGCGTEDIDSDTDGYFACLDDCDDTDFTVYPGATEIKHDGVDQDCNGYDLTIDIIDAKYAAKRDTLKVQATSELEEGANLELIGHGSMQWKHKRSIWKIAISGAGGDPGIVTVCGIEGCESITTTTQ